MANKIFPALILLFLATFASAAEFSGTGYSPEEVLDEDRKFNLYESWLVKHKKVYNSLEEKQQRYEIFKDNLGFIEAVNQKNQSYWLGLNEFADMSHDEFKSKYLGTKPNMSNRLRGYGKPFRYENVVDIPNSVDWRKQGAVTRIKNQASCGSCWAFSTVAAVEGINKIITGNLIPLSEQELVDCDKPSNQGCNGGVMDYAYAFIISNGGIDSEEDYPYKGRETRCDAKKMKSKVVSIDKYEDVPQNNEEALIKALANQPLSVAIQASGREFQFYKGGVFSGPCGIELDHGVAAVGYAQDHIIVKNSWGPHWGEEGYIRMQRGMGKHEGMCGINQMASYPVKSGPNPPKPSPSPSPPKPTPPPPPSPTKCDDTYSCTAGTTCCCMYSMGEICFSWGCCPMTSAVCCDDNYHCCPHDSPVCDVKAGTCRKSPQDLIGVKMMPRTPAHIKGEFEGKAAQ
eukprot:Gb_19399 [translate_table: standard]